MNCTLAALAVSEEVPVVPRALAVSPDMTTGQVVLYGYSIHEFVVAPGLAYSRILYLDHNNVSGTIPYQLGRLQQLE